MADTEKRVLLVEDDEVLSNILSTHFRNNRIECTVAATGEGALLQLGSGAFDLVLLDISLPGMDGFEVLSAMKRDPKTAGIPVIIVSNFSQEKDIAWGKELGAEKFLSKVSVVPADIVSIARETLAAHQNLPH